jgi:hypothetical protein
MTADKQRAHQLLEQPGPGQVAAVLQLLETMAARHDEGDTLSPAERKAIAEADAWLQQNEPIAHQDVLAELGLTMDDWEKMAEEPLPEVTQQHNG